MPGQSLCQRPQTLVVIAASAWAAPHGVCPSAGNCWQKYVVKRMCMQGGVTAGLEQNASSKRRSRQHLWLPGKRACAVGSQVGRLGVALARLRAASATGRTPPLPGTSSLACLPAGPQPRGSPPHASPAAAAAWRQAGRVVIPQVIEAGKSPPRSVVRPLDSLSRRQGAAIVQPGLMTQAPAHLHAEPLPSGHVQPEAVRPCVNVGRKTHHVGGAASLQGCQRARGRAAWLGTWQNAVAGHESGRHG